MLKIRICPKKLHVQRMVRLLSCKKSQAFPEEASFPMATIGRLSEGFGCKESLSVIPCHVCQAACSKGGIVLSYYTHKMLCIKKWCFYRNDVGFALDSCLLLFLPFSSMCKATHSATIEMSMVWFPLLLN